MAVNFQETNPQYIQGMFNEIGHGNPMTWYLMAWALTHASAQEKIALPSYNVLPPIRLPFSSKMGQVFHKSMTGFLRFSQIYSAKSETTREGQIGEAFARIAGVEAAQMLIGQAGILGSEAALNIVVTQEHSLWGLTLVPEWVQQALQKKVNVRSIFLAHADTLPKASGVRAVRMHETARLLTWNPQAYDLMTGRDMPGIVYFDKPHLAQPVQLMESWFKPYFRDRRAQANFDTAGKTIVCKSSGSGLPQHILEAVSQGLERSRYDYALHLPSVIRGRSTGGSDYTQPQDTDDIEQKIFRFLRDIGGRTRLLIVPPNELMGMTMVLHKLGLTHIACLTFDVRGYHELLNRDMAIKMGIHGGDFQITDASNLGHVIDHHVQSMEEHTGAYPEKVEAHRDTVFSAMDTATTIPQAILGVAN